MSGASESVEALVRAFTERTLPREQWTHRAHLAVAVSLIREQGLPGALTEMPGLIQRYNVQCGVANSDTSGYHATLTIAFLRCVAGMLAHIPRTTDLATVVDLVAQSPLGQSDWPLQYWSAARLWSTEARRAWVEPDLRPNPLF